MKKLISNALAFVLVAGISSAVGQQISGGGGGGGGTPGGSNKQVQYNNSGAFGGNASLVFDSATHMLGFGGLTSSFIGIQQGGDHALAGSRLSVRLGDDSDWGYAAVKGLEFMSGSSRLGILDLIASGPRLASADASVGVSLDASSVAGTGIIALKGLLQTTAPVAIPTLSACGTSPTIVTGSTDTAGEVTIGSSATGCQINFGSSRPAAPFCTVSSQGGIVFTYTLSTSAITLTAVGTLSSTKIDYHCFEHG